MGSIFISYRRDDTEGQAGRLYDDLVAVFGSGSVFMDVAAIQPGRDFRKAIDQSLNSCGVFLSLIGRNWLTAADASGKRRVDDPADFVRIETAAVLKRDIPVIPVLVQGATAVKPDQLPDDLKDLAYRNAVELTHPRWESDVQLLINAVRPYVSEPKPRRNSIPVKYLLSAAAVLILLGIMFYLRPGEKGAVPSEGQSTGATSSAVPDSVKPDGSVKQENSAPQSPNAAPAKPGRVGDFSLAAEQEPLPNKPNRYTYTLSLKAAGDVISDISRVHYDLVLDTNPLSLDGSSAPRFSAVYEGWGCYETVVVTVYFKSGASNPQKKTFNMCDALPRLRKQM